MRQNLPYIRMPPVSKSLTTDTACSRLFCVTTVSIVCTIKVPVPVRAEDGLYRVPLIRTGAPNGRNPMDMMRQG